MLSRSVLLRWSQPCCRLNDMPLKAKIRGPTMTTNRSLAASTAIPKELPGDDPDDVVFGTKYGVRTIELNRPKKLNSLNASMARKIIPRLLEWQKSQMANVIVIKGAGRAFCAGGDVTALAKQIQDDPLHGQKEAVDYFALEYKLDHLIATYTKPYVAFMDGITMGGGVGLTIHAPFRIATENTIFAMPETTIGFFPDVGASFFLPKMDGGIGMYLGLTSEQLKGVNVFYSGLATHYLDSTSLPDLEARLAELQFKDHAPTSTRLDIINATIEEFTTGIPHDARPALTGDVRKAIDYCFGPHRSSINDTLTALDEIATADLSSVPQHIRDWAKTTQNTLATRSPTSLHVSFRQLRSSRAKGIAHIFRAEYALAAKFMSHPDFAEGVAARLVRKEPPKWSPAALDQVREPDIDAFFQDDDGAELALLGQDNYTVYPHASRTGLPSEERVRSAVKDQRFANREEVVRYFLELSNHKMGVREQVGEILERKTGVGDEIVYWEDD